jgi:hypothetical protein
VPISNACVSGASRSVVPMMHLSRLAGAVKTWIAGIQFYPTMLASYRQAVRAILQLRWLTRPWPCSSERCQRDGAGVKYAGAHVRSSGGSEGSHLLMQIKQMGGSRCEENNELLIEEYLWLKRLYTEIQWYDPTCSNLQRFAQTERPHDATPLIRRHLCTTPPLFSPSYLVHFFQHDAVELLPTIEIHMVAGLVDDNHLAYAMVVLLFVGRRVC